MRLVIHGHHCFSCHGLEIQNKPVSGVVAAWVAVGMEPVWFGLDHICASKASQRCLTNSPNAFATGNE